MEDKGSASNNVNIGQPVAEVPPTPQPQIDTSTASVPGTTSSAPGGKVSLVNKIMISIISVLYVLLAVALLIASFNAIGHSAGEKQGLGMILFLGWMIPPVPIMNIAAIIYFVMMTGSSNKGNFKTDVKFKPYKIFFIGSVIAAAASVAFGFVVLAV